jgi:hypothetical protein
MHMITWKQTLAAALLAASSQAWAAPLLTADLASNPVVFGAAFDVDVNIADIADLYGYQFTINYDASVLQAVGVTEGGFLGSAGSTFSDGGVIDNGAGSISFIFNTLISAVPGASGSGNLARIGFQAIGVGTSTVSFSDVIFLDSNVSEITVGADKLAIGVVPEPASYMLFGIGLVGAAALRRRRLTPHA